MPLFPTTENLDDDQNSPYKIIKSGNDDFRTIYYEFEGQYYLQTQKKKNDGSFENVEFTAIIPTKNIRLHKLSLIFSTSQKLLGFSYVDTQNVLQVISHLDSNPANAILEFIEVSEHISTQMEINKIQTFHRLGDDNIDWAMFDDKTTTEFKNKILTINKKVNVKVSDIQDFQRLYKSLTINTKVNVKVPEIQEFQRLFAGLNISK